MTSFRRLDPEEEEIVMWAALPKAEREKTPLSPKKAERYERANVADNLIRVHLSLKIVTERLMEKFGYSDRTAQRDIMLSQALWGSQNKLRKDYALTLLWDVTVESMLKASRDRNWNAVGRLVAEAKDIAVKMDNPASNPEDLSRPVPIVTLYKPALVGGHEMTEAERAALVKMLLRAKRGSGIIDSDFEEQPPRELGDGAAE